MPLPVFLAAAAFGTDVGKGLSQYNSYQDQLDAINLQSKVTRLQYVQKSISNYESVEKLLASQTALASVRGYGLDSGSFNAIQRSTFNTGYRNQKNTEIEKSIADANAEIEKKNVKDKFIGEIFGDVSDAVKTGSSIYSNKIS